MGTESAILTKRVNDNLSEITTGLFMSVHNWGEDPNGEWGLTSNPVYEKMRNYFINILFLFLYIKLEQVNYITVYGPCISWILYVVYWYFIGHHHHNMKEAICDFTLVLWHQNKNMVISRVLLLTETI